MRENDCVGEKYRIWLIFLIYDLNGINCNVIIYLSSDMGKR